ncbi:MAG TPA: asparaginase [Candidatus Baltobacteraceae bacterium]|nr:asparaginase [Candidatus Baltobacteraceae bacterium]
MYWELAGVPAVAARRGGRVESVHCVAACAADARGEVALKIGTVETPVFLRSSAKPFIAAASVRAGVLERFGFGERELAVMCASHNGEPDHVALVASMLERIGASVADLECGAHPPAYEPAAQALAARGEQPSALHNNCSGKHAGILALAKVLGAPFEGYLEPGHPAQREILALCGRVSDDTFSGDTLAVDGCGIPVYATTLRKAATSFARLATLEQVDDADATALARVGAAMASEPWYVGGTARFDTDLMRATRGRVVAKAGAEAVHCTALLDAGLGLSLKVLDGGRRATAPAALALLDDLRVLEPEARAALAPHVRVAVKNVAGKVVGEVSALEGWIPPLEADA